MPAKLSGRIRYEKRFYKMNNSKRLLLEELAKEAEALENANERLASQLERALTSLSWCYGKHCEEWRGKGGCHPDCTAWEIKPFSPSTLKER